MHTYPKRKHHAGEPVAPDPLTDDLQGVATKLGGRLDEQDLDAASFKANLIDTKVAPDAYYKAHQVVKAASPNLTRGGGQFYAQIGSVAGDPVASVYDAVQWTPLVDAGSSSRLSKTMDTEDDVLVIFAMCQHFAWKGSDTTLTPGNGTDVRLQYALRYDDIVLENTVTGSFFYPDPPAQSWYRATPQSATKDADYRHLDHSYATVGINNACHPARMIWAVPVTDGSHTVDVVARRTPRRDNKIDEDGSGVTVQVFNRRLFVLRIRGGAAYSGSAPDTVVDGFEDGQAFTLASIFTNGQDRLRTKINDIEPQHIARGALSFKHLASLVYGAKGKGITPASPTATITGTYPGYGVDGAGWTTVTNAGDNLELTGPAGTGNRWRLDTYPGVFVVLANVQVWKISWAGGWGGSMEDLRAIAVFALAITNSAGTRTVLGETEVYINGHNPHPYVTGLEPIGDDAPLMWVVDSTTLSAANKDIAKIEVLASVWNGVDGTAGQVELKTQRGSITAFCFKRTGIT